MINKKGMSAWIWILIIVILIVIGIIVYVFVSGDGSAGGIVGNGIPEPPALPSE